MHDGRGAPARARGRRALLRSARGCAPRGHLSRGRAHLRVRADQPRRAGGDDAPARHRESRRHPPQPAARDGPLPGRLLHLPGDRDPARLGAARQRAGEHVADRRSCRSAGRASSRSSTATSCARRGWTTGSSRACSACSTCRDDAAGASTPRAGAWHDTIVVIGAGLAGLTAAAAAGGGGRARARAGQRRRLDAPARRQRSTSSATMPTDGVARPAEALPAFTCREPEHPYGLSAAPASSAASSGSRTASPRARVRLPTSADWRELPSPDRGGRGRRLRAGAGDDGRTATCAAAAASACVGLPRAQGLLPGLLADNLSRGRGRVTARAVEVDAAARRARGPERAGLARPRRANFRDAVVSRADPQARPGRTGRLSRRARPRRRRTRFGASWSTARPRRSSKFRRCRRRVPASASTRR